MNVSSTTKRHEDKMLRGSCTVVNILLPLLLVLQQTYAQYYDGEECNNGNGVRAHLRLVGFGSSASAGYLEVCKQGEWYNVTVADVWGRKEAAVVCKQLGFPDAITFSHVKGRNLAQSSKWMQFENISCTGTEKRLTDCKGTGQIRSNPTPRNLMNQVLVLCNQDPVLGTLRLVGEGYEENKGILQIYNNHLSYAWGSVCSNGWTDKEADVACRQMGFASGKSKLYSFDNSARILRRKRYDYFRCNGTEETLLECSHRGPYPYKCISPKYAGVICDGEASHQEQSVPLYISVVLLSSTLLVLLILILSVALICMAKKMKKKWLVSNGQGFQNLNYEVYPFQYPDITNYVPPPTYEETIFSSNGTEDDSQSTTAILDTERDPLTAETTSTSNESLSSLSTEETADSEDM